MKPLRTEDAAAFSYYQGWVKGLPASNVYTAFLHSRILHLQEYLPDRMEAVGLGPGDGHSIFGPDLQKRNRPSAARMAGS
jgi:hypothetical protein